MLEAGDFQIRERPRIKPTDDQWYAEVVRICQEMSYPKWFYSDRAAWLECSGDMTPFEAVKYQLECAA